VHSGQTSATFDLQAGVHHVETPFSLGAQRFVLEREGKTVLDKTGEHEIVEDAWANFNYFGGSVSG
jgi:hypothetical protein